MALFGSLSTLRAQAPRHRFLETSFAYLADLYKPGTAAHARLASVAVGETHRVELSDGIFALEQAYFSKEPIEGKWESHRAYIDVQALVEGEEVMAVCDVGRLNVSEDLTPAKDLLFYAASDVGSRLRLYAGEAAIFFPVDAHIPCLRSGQRGLVRKSVVKVPVF